MDAWIDSVSPPDATGLLRELYDRVAVDGEVDHVVQAHSLVPDALEALLVFYQRVMHGRNDLPGNLYLRASTDLWRDADMRWLRDMPLIAGLCHLLVPEPIRLQRRRLRGRD